MIYLIVFISYKESGTSKRSSQGRRLKHHARGCPSSRSPSFTSWWRTRKGFRSRRVVRSTGRTRWRHQRSLWPGFMPPQSTCRLGTIIFSMIMLSTSCINWNCYLTFQFSVLGTDYKNFLSLYSCLQQVPLLKMEAGLVLTRSRIPGDELVSKSIMLKPWVSFSFWFVEKAPQMPENCLLMLDNFLISCSFG